MELDSCIASPFIPEEILRQKYLENRLSTRAIASEFSCSKTYVRSLLLKYNIPMRKTSDYRGYKLYAYGKRQGKGWHNCTVAEILKREGVYISGKVLA